MEDKVVKLPVRVLVEFVLRSGSIDSTFMKSSRAVEGTMIHGKIQRETKKAMDEIGKEYIKEYSIKSEISYKDILFKLEGRIDGIIIDKDNNEVIIQEIKSTYLSIVDLLDYNNERHLAQAKLYGYMYCKLNNMENIKIKLTYFSIKDEAIHEIMRDFSLKELEEFSLYLIDKYLYIGQYTIEWINTRNKSIKELSFPFSNYRKGQRELAVCIYRTVCDNNRLFVEAPTGTGKTISSLFPAIKGMGEDKTNKIFYLTAKNVLATVVEETILKLYEKGLKVKVVNLTAKEKVCFLDKVSCNPEGCQYAAGHFDRVNEAIYDALENDDYFSSEVIKKYASKHKVCPFEFSLDLTNYSDLIVGDYNYIFDPKASLKRYKDNLDEYTLIIDEAHNLVNRSREMYSATLDFNSIENIKKLFKDNKEVSKIIKRIYSYFTNLDKELGENSTLVQEFAPVSLYDVLVKFISIADEYLSNTEPIGEAYEAFLQFYFDVHSFLRIFEFFSDDFVTYIFRELDNIKLKLYCLNPSDILKDITKDMSGSIFLSATLSPIYYYKNILGGEDKDNQAMLKSPFDRENYEVLVANNISTRFKDRENTYSIITEYIYSVINAKKGNYLVFLPSYSYLNEVYNTFKYNYGENEFNFVVQRSGMTNEESSKFLDEFNENNTKTTIGFAVMGGVFSEGVDLQGDRLIGAIIISVGLPQVCAEVELIKDYFDKKSSNGFEYAYMYPGMNKVLQSAGRVIRKEEDRGVILLIDDRFTHRKYKEIMPSHYKDFKIVSSKSQLQLYINNFWTK